MKTPLLITKKLMSYSNIKGSYFIEEKAVRVLEEISKKLWNKLKANKIRCPLFLNYQLLQLESSFRQFSKECFKIQDRKKYLKPTSELLLLEKVKSDLFTELRDLRYYMDSSVFRKETVQNYPGIRHDQIMYFMEGHFFHEQEPMINKEIRRVEKIYDNLFNSYGIPFFKTWRPKQDLFPGSNKTLAYNYVTSSGKILQIGTIHNLGTSFTVLNNLTRNGKILSSCSYGISQRILTPMVEIIPQEEHPLFYETISNKNQLGKKLVNQQIVYFPPNKEVYSKNKKDNCSLLEYKRKIKQLLHQRRILATQQHKNRISKYVSKVPGKYPTNLGTYEEEKMETTYWGNSF